jgi:hypothetical protein
VRSLLVVVAIAALGMTLIWAVAVPIGPDACALSYPGPRNCFVYDRVDSAILPTILLGVITVVASSAIALLPRARRAVTILSAILVVAVIAVSYVRVAWVPVLA